MASGASTHAGNPRRGETQDRHRQISERSRLAGFARVRTTKGEGGLRPSILELADVMLRVEFDAELLHEVELRLKEVDVAFFVLHQVLEEIA